MTWAEMTVGTETAGEFRIDSEDMSRFAEISGDTNPLHTDDAYAQRLGFDKAVVYGALLVAKVSGLIGMKLPGTGGIWSGVKMDFRNPLYVGETARVTGIVSHRSEATNMLVLKLRIDAAERRIATGAAEIVYRAND